ncbi:PIG-L deacetylase family protein [Endozoicomonadaceae bacterium StTr2]
MQGSHTGMADLDKKQTKKSLKYKKRKQKRLMLTLLLSAFCCVIITAYTGIQYGLLILLFFYILYELLDADHLFYLPSSDYQYQFQADYYQSTAIDQISANPTTECSTWLLALPVKATVSGFWFDPYIIISFNNKQERQYLERRSDGLRYLNLSCFAEALNSGHCISLQFKHCRASKPDAELLGFKHPDYSRKRVLIISPHADDAEIAAFGLYSQSKDVHIVTLTAGEIQMEQFQHVYENPDQASRLKGRLRALDSIAVPLWGKVPQENCINLGYFCKRLKDMHKEPDKPVSSLTASLTDTRLFREYNSRKLSSDENGQPTWCNLVQDLTELIDAIKPEVILTPLTELDKHPDHIYGSYALYEALSKAAVQPESILHYANHYHTTDMFPFGPEHAVGGVPPCMELKPSIYGVVSWPMTIEQQKDKVYALEMMHDLKRPQKLKKMIRVQLQRLIGRRPNRYGAEGYFRKAIKSNELFLLSSAPQRQKHTDGSSGAS